MAASKKAVKKELKSNDSQLYVISSNMDNDLYPMSLQEAMTELDEWGISSEEIVTIYKLVPYKKYKAGQRYVEIK